MFRLYKIIDNVLTPIELIDENTKVLGIAQHLISAMMYTDDATLCADFDKQVRQLFPEYVLMNIGVYNKETRLYTSPAVLEPLSIEHLAEGGL